MTKQAPKQRIVSKPGKKAGGKKKRKVSSKFNIDCSRPVEDGIMNANHFVSQLFDHDLIVYHNEPT